MEKENTAALLKVLHNYAVPDPKIVGILPRGGAQLPFVGHADITRLLIEIDPHWRLVPIAWDNGRPAMHIVNDMATCWFEMTLLGEPRLAVGTAKANSTDLDKIVYGDALRNGAMRFGIGLSLWTKQEWDDLGENPAPSPAPAPARVKAASQRLADRAKQGPSPLTDEQRAQFVMACEKAGIEPATVARNAQLDWETGLTEDDLPALRSAFHELKAFKEGA